MRKPDGAPSNRDMDVRSHCSGAKSEPAIGSEQKPATPLELCLAAEVKSLRAEAQNLPPGDLRDYIEEVAKYAEVLLFELRR